MTFSRKCDAIVIENDAVVIIVVIRVIAGIKMNIQVITETKSFSSFSLSKLFLTSGL